LTRGLKQGDPISGLLFVAVLEACMKKLKAQWNIANARRTGLPFGIAVGQGMENLTDLRFADDTVIVVEQVRCDQNAGSIA